MQARETDAQAELNPEDQRILANMRWDTQGETNSRHEEAGTRLRRAMARLV